SPYGAEDNDPTLTNPTPEEHGFIGERFDASTGLQYLNARYYDPDLGRFIQPDWWEVTLVERTAYSPYGAEDNDAMRIASTSHNCCSSNRSNPFLAPLPHHEPYHHWGPVMNIETIAKPHAALLTQGLLWFDRQGHVVDLNLHAARMLRADPGWMLLQDYHALCGQPQPDAALQGEWRKILAGSITSVERKLVAANGALVPVSLSFSRRPGATTGRGDRILALVLNLEGFG
ncbi:MAG: RHS repeat-associated core domain-containing protein, partial [Paracoccaceae bacterium]